MVPQLGLLPELAPSHTLSLRRHTPYACPQLRAAPGAGGGDAVLRGRDTGDAGEQGW